MGNLILASVLFFSINAAALASEPTPSTKYAEVQAQMRQLAATYPDRVAVVKVGDSDSGKPIEALRIGTGGVANLAVATHHGNEYGSTELAKALMESVAQAPLVGQTLYVIPVLNIGGYDARERRETAGGRSWDPNRDYPGPCGTEGPHRLQSTAALARFIDENQIVASSTLHTSWPAVLYPWGVSASGADLLTRYDTLFINLSKAAAVESGYQVGNATEVLYAADGAFEDYAFWKHGIWSLLFEVGHSHTPNLTAVKEIIRGNVPGLRRFYEQAPRTRAEQHAFTGACDSKTQRRRRLE